MFHAPKIVFFVIIIFFVLALGGCSIKEKLTWLDNELGKIVNDIDSSARSARLEQAPSTVSTSSPQTNPMQEAGELSKDFKEKIDLWLSKNGYNRYGDPIDTMYAGGTPLFNEKTGERIDRFDYIFKKIPNISSLIKN